ncbi:MAG: transporter permease [Eubacterium sp.]|nr:transporter permease [Eubacterium sp.]
MSMSYKKKKISLFELISFLILTVIGVVTIFPFYNVLILSLANHGEAMRRSVYLLPYSFDLTSIKTILSEPSFLRSVGVSAFVTVVGVLVSMTVTTMGAYALSKKSLPGRNLILGMVLFTMFFNGGLIPYYLVLKKIGFVNNLAVMILPAAVSAFYLIVMKNFFRSIPESLEESARIDGAGDFYILYKIVIPLSTPIIATFSLFYAVDRWNDWWSALIFISDQRINPLQIFLREMLVSFNNSMLSAAAASAMENKRTVYFEGAQMAAVVISVLPIAVLYPCLQKYFVKGILVGSVKE